MTLKRKRLFTRPVTWIAAGLLIRFGMDLVAEIMLKKKRRKKDVYQGLYSHKYPDRKDHGRG